MHLRAPSVDHGFASFIWAIVFFLILWLGMLAVGVGSGTALFISIVAAALIFLFVRVQGQEELGSTRRRRS
jgi:hypothetical protein